MRVAFLTTTILAGVIGLFTQSVTAAGKGELTVAQPILRQQFDPTSMVVFTDFTTYDIMFDGLLDLGPKGKEAALAESWTVSLDGKQIDFKLRHGVKFSNGDPFTADDVKFTYDRIVAPDSTHSYRQGFVEHIDSIEVVAPDHVRFRLKGPWPSFFTSARYSLTGIVPKKYYERVGAKGFQQKPVGTGPFRLVDLKSGEWNRFEANESYWRGSPRVKTVVVKLVKEPFTGYAMLERGEADIVLGLTGPLLEKLKSNPDLKIMLSHYSGTSSLQFGKKDFPEARDPRVRMAIAYAIDFDAIAKKVLGGVCERATGIFTPATFGYLEGLPMIPYDPKKAKALLAEVGIKPGHKVSFSSHTESFGSLPNGPQVLEAIAGYLEAVGFKLDRQPLDTAAWLAMLRAAKQPGIYYGPSSAPDDGGETINGWYASWAVWSGGNVNVPQYDELYKRQLMVSDPKERTKILQQFARLENERVEAVPMFWCHTPFAVSKRVKKWDPAVASGYHLNLSKLELAD